MGLGTGHWSGQAIIGLINLFTYYSLSVDTLIVPGSGDTGGVLITGHEPHRHSVQDHPILHCDGGLTP